MAFRRQDIPKTTRKSDDGGPRRLYPRYIRDRALLPKVELAIDYLDGMVGRKRADLSSDVVLDLFGDPKLARCLLSCLAETYRYRTPEIAELTGDEAARALAEWGLSTPADIRDHLYRLANAEYGGFVSDTTRPAFLTQAATPLGLDAETLERLIHLDAERNALLMRVGPKPVAEDVVARYNALLTLSVLRHASTVTLSLPGLDGTTVETVCTRQEVRWQRAAGATYRLSGQRDLHGSWVRFGAKLARCAAQLLILCPTAPEGEALVQLNGQSLRFVLDAKSVSPLRPKHRAAADGDGVLRAARLAEDLVAHRRRADGGSNGWTIRRSLEPIVVKDAIVLPEIALTRDRNSIAVAPAGNGAARASSLAALQLAHGSRQVIALGVAGGIVDMPALEHGDAAALLGLLDRIERSVAAEPTPIQRVGVELVQVGWLATSRIVELLGEGQRMAAQVEPLTADGDAVFVAGFGLCRTSFLDDLHDRLLSGPVDIPVLRSGVAACVGDGAGVDALTLHLLSRRPVTINAQDQAADRQEVAAA